MLNPIRVYSDAYIHALQKLNMCNLLIISDATWMQDKLQGISGFIV